MQTLNDSATGISRKVPRIAGNCSEPSHRFCPSRLGPSEPNCRLIIASAIRPVQPRYRLQA